jgi:hypothetical protein
LLAVLAVVVLVLLAVVVLVDTKQVQLFLLFLGLLTR